MKRKRESEPGNLALRLAQRELVGAPPAAAVNKSRRLFESVVPNAVIRGVAPPPGHCIARFTPCGRFLVSFDALRNEVVLHTYRGLNTATSSEDPEFETEKETGPPAAAAGAPQTGPFSALPPAATSVPAAAASPAAQQPQFPARGSNSSSAAQPSNTSAPPQPSTRPPRPHRPPPPSITFEDAFSVHTRVSVVTGLDEQLFAFCVVVQDDYLVLASSTPDARPIEGGEEGVWMGVSECVTFHCLHMMSGTVLDRITLPADSMHLTHHQGAVSLLGDTMAVVAPSQQSIYLVKIGGDGRFKLFRTLGRQCRPDDAAAASAQVAVERRAMEEERRRRRRRAAAAGEGAAGGSAGDSSGALYSPMEAEEEDGDAQQHPPPAATAAAAGNGEEEAQMGVPVAQIVGGAAGLEEPPSPFLEGLKQRLMAHLYLLALESSSSSSTGGAGDGGSGESPPGPPTATQQQSVRSLSTFYYLYNVHLDLEIQGAVLIDPTRLLISWLPPVTAPGQSPPTLRVRGLHMLFNVETTSVERVFEYGSPSFAMWCLDTPTAALGGGPCNDWERQLVPGLWGRHLRLKDPPSRGGGTGASHCGCQMRQSSPYLDPELFQFDERAVTRDLIPRPPLHRAAKFVARAWPERLRFKFDPDDVGGEAGAAVRQGGDGGRNEVVFIFHPAAPFAMAVLEAAETGLADELAFYTHAS